MIEKIEALLKSKGETLAFAESCTGGWLSAQFVKHPGVSSFYLGSVVAYSNELKKNILRVSQELLDDVGAVSSPVALDMARGLKVLTQASWTVSITGIAGPAGGTKDKPVGTVFFAVVGPDFERSQKKNFSGDRQKIQEDAVNYAIQILTQSLKGEQWT